MIIGLTGKPSSGKSSFFKAATLADVKISPVPFTTLKPDTGAAYVTSKCVCKEFGVSCSPKHGHCTDGVRYIPIRLWDLPGIVRGAHEGRGLGLQFLDSVRQASALIQVVDCSGTTDEEGKPTNNYDPEDEIKFLEEEINLWFASVISKSTEKFKPKLATMSRADLVDMLSQQLSGLEIKKQYIEDLVGNVSVSDVEKFAKELRRLSKPIIFAANKIDLKESETNFQRLKEKYKNIVPTSAEADIALKKAAEKGLIKYLPEGDFEIIDQSKLESSQSNALQFIKNSVISKYGSTGIQTCLNKAVFELLNYIVVYPVADSHKLAKTVGKTMKGMCVLHAALNYPGFLRD